MAQLFHFRRSIPALLFGMAVTAMPATSLAAEPEPRIKIEWSPPIEVASGGGQRGPWEQNESDFNYVDDPTVVLAADGSAAVAWVDQSRKDVFLQIYTADGVSRLPEPVNVSRTPDIFSWLPRVVSMEGQPEILAILWQEIVFSGGSHGGEIFFARSIDGGQSFSEPINLSNSAAGDGKGRITSDMWDNGSLDIISDSQGNLYAAWTEHVGALWFSRSIDRGNSFSTPLRVTQSDPQWPARAPSLAVAPTGEILLVWTAFGSSTADLRIATSADRGLSFGAPRIIRQGRGYSDAPRLAVDADGRVHLVYSESPEGPFGVSHVRYTQSEDRGESFQFSREISLLPDNPSAGAGFPSIAILSHGAALVSWEHFPADAHHAHGVGFTHSEDERGRFMTPVLAQDSKDDSAPNGGQQGRLMNKLSAGSRGAFAVVNSSFQQGQRSRIWLLRGRIVFEQDP